MYISRFTFTSSTNSIQKAVDPLLMFTKNYSYLMKSTMNHPLECYLKSRVSLF